MPGVGAFPEAMRDLHELGLAELIRSAAPRRAVLGICLGMQVLLERSDELEPTDGLGLIRGEVTRLDTGGLRIPHIGWNEVTFERPSPLTAGLPSGGCPFYHVHSLAARPHDPEDVVGDDRVRRARSRRSSAHGSVFGVQFHPEKSSAHGLRMLESFVDVCAEPLGRRAAHGGGARMILLPAIDIRGGKAVRLEKGEFDSEKVYDADPVDAARRWVADGARALHVVDLDGARSGEPANVEHVRRICSEVTVPVQVGGGLRTIEAIDRTIDAGATRIVLGTAAYRDVDFLDARARPSTAIAWSCPSTFATACSRPRGGPSRPRCRSGP